jgi:uncharacterized protein (DUF1330 family)
METSYEFQEKIRDAVEKANADCLGRPCVAIVLAYHDDETIDTIEKPDMETARNWVTSHRYPRLTTYIVGGDIEETG